MTDSQISVILARLDILTEDMAAAKQARERALQDHIDTQSRLVRIETKLEAQAGLPRTIHDNELSVSRSQAVAEERERSRDNVRSNWGLLISLAAFGFAAAAYLRDWLAGQ